MSDESASASPEPQSSSSRSGRSPVEKVIWCIIAVIILGLGLELYAKTSYENTMAAVDDAFNRSKAGAQHLSDVQKLISGLTRYGTPVQTKSASSQEEVEVTWLSPSNKYSFTLVLEKGSDDPVVAWYKMGADNWATDPHTVTTDDVPTQDGMSTDDPTAGVMGSAPGGGAGGGQGGGGGGGGGGRGRRPRGLVGILGEEAVVAELNLTPEQKEQVEKLADAPPMDFRAIQEAPPEQRAMMLETARTNSEAAVKAFLDEAQFTRVWQIDLQRTGLAAVARKDVSTQLNLTDEQNAKLAEITAEADAARSAAMQERNFSAMGEIREQTEQKIQELLTDDQKDQWKELLGPPGPEPPARGGAGGGGGGFGGGGGGGGGQRGSGGDSGRPQRPASDDADGATPAAEPGSASSGQ